MEAKPSHTSLPLHLYIHICVNIMHKYTHISACTHICIYVYIYIYKHTNTWRNYLSQTAAAASSCRNVFVSHKNMATINWHTNRWRQLHLFGAGSSGSESSAHAAPVLGCHEPHAHLVALYACVCVCIYVYTYICIHIRMYIYLNIYTCVYILMGIYGYICIYINI